MAKVAWVGSGATGSRMAVRMAEAGHEVTLSNRSPHRTESHTCLDTAQAKLVANFALRLARKDADLITDAADECGVYQRLGCALAEWSSDTVSPGLGVQAYTAVLGRILSTAPDAGESR